jgi:predicted transcriptional regulator
VPRDRLLKLSRRERQIMDVIYARRRASVAEVLASLPDPPSYSAVRALLGILEGKGHIRHVKEVPRYIYLPTRPRRSAGREALRRVL